jgi:hypothetical protein
MQIEMHNLDQLARRWAALELIWGEVATWGSPGLRRARLVPQPHVGHHHLRPCCPRAHQSRLPAGQTMLCSACSVKLAYLRM